MSETQNTDKELWRGPPDANGDTAYSASIFVTEQGDIGINALGKTVVMSVFQWHALADIKYNVEHEQERTDDHIEDLEDLVLQLQDRIEKLEQAWRDSNSTKQDCSVSIDLAGHYVPDPGAVIAKAIKAME